MKHPILNPSKPLHFLLWIMIAIILCAIFLGVDYVDGISDYHYIYPDTPMATYDPESGKFEYIESWPEPIGEVEERIVWALTPSLTILVVTALYVLYVFPTVMVYHNANRVGRNAVRWATAFVVFTPLLAGIAYLLTWPKGQ